MPIVWRDFNEKRKFSLLNHPNIAAIYDLQEANGSRYLVLELVDGAIPATTDRFTVCLNDDAVVQLDDLVCLTDELPDGRALLLQWPALARGAPKGASRTCQRRKSFFRRTRCDPYFPILNAQSVMR